MPRGFSVLNLIKEQTIKYSNLPERYIKRASEQIYYKAPRGPQWQNVVRQRKSFYFDVHRPWTQGFKQDNAPRKHVNPALVEPVKDWNFFLGDVVEVLVGKDKGKQGTVKHIFQERNWVIVSGLNTKLELVGKYKDIKGVYVQKEQPLLITNEVSLVDPSDLSPTSIEWRYNEDGDRVRVSTRTGRIIPMPAMSEATIDYKFKVQWKESPKDTPKDLVKLVTFKPELKTFEMDIMEKMGVKEDRVPKPTFWY